MFGIDHSSKPPAPTRLKVNKVGFVGRYLSTAGNPKNLTKLEADALLKAGIAVVPVFETTANRALSGHAAGVFDAHSARAQATACGLPASAPIYFAVDFDATPAQQAPINAYLTGAASVLGHNRVGVYGGYYVVKRCLDAKVCKYGWQTYAWSGGQWDPRAHIRQYLNGQKLAGISVDFDHSMDPDFGQTAPIPKPVPVPPPPKPVPPPPPPPPVPPVPPPPPSVPVPPDLTKVPAADILAELARRLKTPTGGPQP